MDICINSSKVVIPAILVYTVDFYNFMSLSVTLNLVGAHEVSAKQNLLASFSSDQEES